MVCQCYFFYDAGRAASRSNNRDAGTERGRVARIERGGCVSVCEDEAEMLLTTKPILFLVMLCAVAAHRFRNGCLNSSWTRFVL